MAFSSALGGFFQFNAIRESLVAYVVALKRTGIVWSVLFGYWLFGEKGLGGRLAGVILMVAGVGLIALAG